MSIKNKGGFILIAAFLVIVLLLILSGVFFMSSLTEQRIAERHLATATAFYLAEAGIDDAIVRLRTDNMYAGTTPSTTSLGTQGVFETRVTQPDPTNQPTLRLIESWGYTPEKDPSAYGYQEKKLNEYVDVTPAPLFPKAIFAQGEIDILGGSLVDSYNSSQGPYDPNNPGSNADIGSNNVDGENDVIELSGESTVMGDAVVGPSVPYQSAIEVSSNSTITGTQTNNSTVITLDPPTIPDGTTSIDLSNVTSPQSYSGGEYSTSSIKIVGSGYVQFTGPTTLYVSGTVDIGGNGMVTADNIPANLIIKVVGSYNVKMTGTSNFYGGVYAPQSEVVVSGTGGFFGAIVGDEVKLSGSAKLHYDEAMGDVPGGAGYTVTVLGWHESVQ